MDNVTDWLEEIKIAKKREEDYRKDGKMIFDIYEKSKATPFNILYSNTETLIPAIISNTPRPVVKKRFTDNSNPLDTAVAKTATRMLEYLVDTDHDRYEKFDDALKKAVIDGLLPGRGVTAIKYDANFVKNEEGEEEDVDYEMICADSKKWDRVYFGYATKWSNVPWIAYEEELDRKEAKKLFGDQLVAELKFTESDDDDDEYDKENTNKGKRETIWVYQVWDKSDRTVKYICDQYKDDYLAKIEDPLGLTGFFNCPEPITFVEKSNSLMVTALYSLYEEQARELNDIQRRLTKVIKAIKVRGVYDGSLGSEIEMLLKEDDNELIPTDKNTLLLEKGGFDKSIWFMPIEKLVQVAAELYRARESCKQVIYEITGISDIIRGQSKASETLGAQEIKQAWGTMRLKNYQKEGQRYALDVLRIMLEIAVKQLSIDTWKAITDLPYPTEEEQLKAQEMLKAGEQEAKMRGGQMPPPPPELLAKAQMPTWEKILGVLKDDRLRMYRVDIETNSTLDVEATEDKALIAEFMNALAQFMNGIQPLIKDGYMDFDVAKGMLMEIVRRYRFGRDVEEHINKMQKPKGPPIEQQQKQMEERGKQLQQQMKAMEQREKQLQTQEQQLAQEVQQAKEQLTQQSAKLEADRMRFEMDKQLEAERRKMQDQLRAEKQKIAEERMEMEIESKLKDARNDMKAEIENNQRAIQSMLDKATAMMTKSMSEKSEKSEKSEMPAINIVNELPKKQNAKVVRKNGQIEGIEYAD